MSITMHTRNDTDVNTNIALIDGVQIKYNACSEKRNGYECELFTYIGKGKIYSVGGILQSGFNDLYFFKRK